MAKPKLDPKLPTKLRLGWSSTATIDALKALTPRMSDEELGKTLHFFREELSARMATLDPEDLGWMRMTNALDSLTRQEREAYDFAIRQKLVAEGGDGQIHLVWADGTPLTAEMCLPGTMRRLMLEAVNEPILEGELCENSD